MRSFFVFCFFPSGHGCTLKTRAGLISGERWRGRWEFTIRSPFIPLSHDIGREAADDDLVGGNEGGGCGGRATANPETRERF